MRKKHDKKQCRSILNKQSKSIPERKLGSFFLLKIDKVCIALIILMIGLDQLTKFLVRNFVHHRKILEYLCIEEVWNSGVSFGLFHSLPNSDLIFSVLSSLISIVLFFYLIKSYNKILKASLSLIIAGAIGNVIDRLRFGAVYDFIDIHWHQWHWPAFNFADVFITLGALFLIYPRRVEDGISKRNRSCN